jgi:hypothetical protein
MPVLRWDLPSLVRFVAVALLAAVAGYALRGPADTAAHKPADSVPGLVAHLEQRGIHLRVIPTARDGDVCEGAFLTRTTASWEQLSFWLRLPEHLPHWRDTVQVQPERNAQIRAEEQASWGEGCLVYGQLVLFGDPDLLAEIRTALGR